MPNLSIDQARAGTPPPVSADSQANSASNRDSCQNETEAQSKTGCSSPSPEINAHAFALVRPRYPMQQSDGRWTVMGPGAAPEEALAPRHVFNEGRLKELFSGTWSELPDDWDAICNDEAVRFSYALILARNESTDTALTIGAFGFNDENRLIAIARMCSVNNSRFQPLSFKAIASFGIRDRATIRELVNRTINSEDRSVEPCWDPESLQTLFPDPEERLDVALRAFKRARREEDCLLVSQLNIEDPRVLLRFADLALPRCEPNMVSSWFKDPPEDVRLALAKMLARRGSANALNAIVELNLRNPVDRLAVAHAFILRMDDHRLDLIEKLQLPQDEGLRVFAHAMAEHGKLESMNQAMRCGITDSREILELAKTSMTKRRYRVTSFGFQDPAMLRELLLWCVDHQTGVGAQLHEFGEIDYAERLRLANVCAEKDPSNTASAIEAWRLNSEDKMALVKKLIAIKPDQVVSQLGKLKMDNASMVEIATLCAKIPSTGLPNVIKEFGIQDATLRGELLIECMRSGAHNLIYTFKNFEIEDEGIAGQLVRHVMKTRAADLLYNWKQFGITSPELLREVVLLALRQSPHSLRDFAKQLPADDPEWFEFIKWYAARDHVFDLQYTFRAIRTFSSEKREELAFFLAHNTQELGPCLKSLDIESREIRTALAHAVVQKFPYGFAAYVEAFKLEDPELEVDLMRQCAAHIDIYTAISFLKRREDPNLSREFAMLYARMDGLNTVRHLGWLGLNDADKIEVFRAALNQDTNRMPMVYADPKDMGDATTKRELMTLALSLVPESLKAPSYAALDHQLAFVGELAYSGWKSDEGLKAFERIVAEPGRNRGFEWLPDFLRSIEDPFAQEQLALRAAATFMLCKMWLTDGQTRAFGENGFLQHILSTHAPERILPYATLLVRAFGEGNADPIYKAATPLRLEHSTKFGPLLRAFTSALEDQGVNTAGFKKWLEMPKIHRVFRDAPKMRQLLDACLSLYEADLPAQAKEAVLARLANFRDVKNLNLIFQLKEGALLEEPNLSTAALADKAVGHHLDLSRVPDALTRTAETFGKSHQPDSIWQLLAKAEATDQASVKESFGAFFFAVLTGELDALRVDASKNAQIARLEEISPGSVARFNTALPSEAVDSISAQQSFDARQWLTRCLVEQYHLGDSMLQMPNLSRTIASTSYRQKGSSAALYGQEFETFEGAVVALLDAKDLPTQLSALEALNLAVKNLPGGGAEFANDVSTQRAMLMRRDNRPAQPLMAIDTSDPHVVMRIGSDVAGSCQRLDGNPHLNKGIHGYLLHGQTRVSGIIEPATKRIIARAVVRHMLAGKQDVVFEEPVYGDPRYSATIRRRNLEKAKRMNAPLCVFAKDSGDFGQDLTSEGGIAAFEYSDAMRGLCPQGKFTIPAKNVKVIWQPGEP